MNHLKVARRAMLAVLLPGLLGGAGDALWRGAARLMPVGELIWGPIAGGAYEQAGWFMARQGLWYAFNRVTVAKADAACPHDHTAVVVRTTADRGKTWSVAVPVSEPGDSPRGDGCAILDGSVYFDAPTATWHMIAQCLDRNERGGWSMCHYTRRGTTIGRFVADEANPVVAGGQLWSRICAGDGKACPITVVDEGTPEIIEKTDGRFIVTMHGFDPVSRHGFRGVVATPDFHRWDVAGHGLPNDATLGPADCGSWLRNCAGVGEASTLINGDHRYLVVETMDKGLACVPNQQWIFQLIRTKLGPWPKSGRGAWNRRAGAPFISPRQPDGNTLCQVQYARWLVDGPDIYLIYEDWAPARAAVHRRLLKVTPDGTTPS